VPDAGRRLAVSAVITGQAFDVGLRAGMTVDDFLVAVSDKVAVPPHLLQLGFRGSQELVEIPDADLGTALLSRTGAAVLEGDAAATCLAIHATNATTNRSAPAHQPRAEAHRRTQPGARNDRGARAQACPS
jgi:hypothetical protein